MMHLLAKLAMQLSVGPVRDLWPLLLAPTLAAAARDRWVREPAHTRGAVTAQALLLAAPGALSLVLIAYAVIDSTPPDKALRWSILWVVAPTLGIALATFAAVRLWGRMSAVRTLFRASAAPGLEFEALGRSLGLRIRQAEAGERTCFVAGFARPTAFVSADLLHVLTPDELRAVLLHERAHARAFDTLVLLLLSGLRDLRPLGGVRAHRTFVAGLERLADAAAVRDCAATDLAAAVLRMGASRGRRELVLAAADPTFVRWRLSCLLTEGPLAAPSTGALVLAAAGAGALLLWPELQHFLHHIYCRD